MDNDDPPSFPTLFLALPSISHHISIKNTEWENIAACVTLPPIPCHHVFLQELDRRLDRISKSSREKDSSRWAENSTWTFHLCICPWNYLSKCCRHSRDMKQPIPMEEPGRTAYQPQLRILKRPTTNAADASRWIEARPHTSEMLSV